MNNAPIAIIGAGIMGSATAYALTRKLQGATQVLLIEADPTFHRGATGRSAGGIRHQFSTPENIALSRATLTALQEIEDVLGPEGKVPLKTNGYLILATPDGSAILRHNAAVQAHAGATSDLLDPAQLADRFPWLAVDGLALGSFGGRQEGWLDPVLWAAALRRAALAQGAELVRDRVVAMSRKGNVITHLTLATGTTLDVSHVVNAAGPWAADIAGMAGLTLPVEPRKRFVYVVDLQDAPDSLRAAPLTVDPSGVWFRPEGRSFICGVSPDDHEEPTDHDLDLIDETLFETKVWPTLAARIPAFERLRRTSAWAGFYDYNTLDQNGIIGPGPDGSNLLFCNGFSGHGLQQGFAAGRAVAELIVDGRFTTLDLQRFSYHRIAEQRPIRELNVI